MAVLTGGQLQPISCTATIVGECWAGQHYVDHENDQPLSFRQTPYQTVSVTTAYALQEGTPRSNVGSRHNNRLRSVLEVKRPLHFR